MSAFCEVDSRTPVLYDAAVVLHVDVHDLGREINGSWEGITLSKKIALPDNQVNHLVVFQGKPIPSLKKDLFKHWLAQVGCGQMKEIENAELSGARATFGVRPAAHSRPRFFAECKLAAPSR